MEDVLCFFPILASSPRDIQEQWAASDAAPGDQVQVLGPDLVRVRTDERLLFLHVFIVGVLWGEPGRTRGEHANSTQKERPRNKPRHVARCGT